MFISVSSSVSVGVLFSWVQSVCLLRSFGCMLSDCMVLFWFMVCIGCLRLFIVLVMLRFMLCISQCCCLMVCIWFIQKCCCIFQFWYQLLLDGLMSSLVFWWVSCWVIQGNIELQQMQVLYLMLFRLRGCMVLVVFRELNLKLSVFLKRLQMGFRMW